MTIRKKNKIVALLLALLLAVGMHPVPVMAAGSLTLDVGSVTAELKAGETVEVPITATANSGYVAGVLDVSWDKTALELTDVEYSQTLAPKGNSAPIPTNNPGKYTIDFGNNVATENYTGTGEFFKLVFKITDTAAAGDYAISLSGFQIYDFDVNELTVTSNPGKVTLTNSSTSTYSVTVNVGANGTASASAASATAGTAITITATPNSGYEIDKITWTPDGGSATDITSSRSFTMPAAKVTVDVSFKASSVTPPGPVTVPEVKQQGTEEPVQQPTKEEKAVISMNAGLKISQTGSKINIKWGKVGEADGYDVYVAYCDKKFGKAVKTINKNSTTSVTVKKINGKKINLKKNFKVYVAAYKMTDGKKEVLAKSIMGHVVGRLNTRYSNAKKITLYKSKYSVKVGKTVKVKAKTVLVDKSKKQLSDAHAAQFRYASSNRNIATVDKNGKVKGVAKGTCTIYVYARNGYAKTVKVTVK